MNKKIVTQRRCVMRPGWVPELPKGGVEIYRLYDDGTETTEYIERGQND